MSLGLIAPPLGVVIGYVMTSYITNANMEWELSFMIQTGLNFIAAFLVLLIPKVYLNLDEVIE